MKAQCAVQPLHVAVNFEELQSQATNVPKISCDYRKIIENANKIYDTASVNFACGDEELAYIYYMRASCLYTVARKNSRHDSKYWSSMCGNKLEKAISNCELLSSNLRKRFDLQNEIKNTERKECDEMDELQKELYKFGPDISAGNNNKENKVNGNDPKKCCSVKLPPAIMLKSTGDSSISPNGDTLTVGCQTLFKWMQKGGTLLLDFRPESEFEKCHIKSDLCLHVSPDILDKGLTASQIENSLKIGDRPTFRKRFTMKNIVLFDWKCNLSDLNRPGSRLKTLRDALLYYDVKMLEKPLHVLLGGFESFLFSYPSVTTNHSYKYQPEQISDHRKSSAASLSSVVYPDLTKIETRSPRNRVTATSALIPDRKLKPKIDDIDRNGDENRETSTDQNISRAIIEKNSEMHNILNNASGTIGAYKREFEDTNWCDANRHKILRQKYNELLEDYKEKVDEMENLKRTMDLNNLRAKKPKIVEISTADKMAETSTPVTADQHESVDDQEIEPEQLKETETAIETCQQELKNIETDQQECLKLIEEEEKMAKDENKIVVGDGVAKAAPKLEIDAPKDKPQVPDRTLKPRDSNITSREIMASQENEFFNRTSRTMTGVSSDVFPGTTGLRNLGNTCYMNSVIQCLSNSRCIKEYFAQDKRYIADINYQNKLGSEGRIARNFAVLIAALWLGRYKYVSPSDFKYTIGSLAVEFANYDQKDAQELLIFALNGLHEDLNKISHKVAIPDQTETNIENFDQAADQSWKNFLANDRSIIIENFYGQFGSVTKCCHCGNASFIFEAFMSLTLPVITTNGKCTLNDCIDKFLSYERLTSDCSKCRANREIYKTMLFRRLPKYLIIHFNRFENTGRIREKIRTFIDFPVSLNLEQYLKLGCGPKSFKLYGVINHYGSMESGHYTAFCRQNDCWYKYDDSDVSLMSQGSIKTDAAYMLFYEAL